MEVVQKHLYEVREVVQLLKRYSYIVENEKSDTKEVVECFIEILKTSIETIDADPETAKTLMHIINHYRNDL